MKKTYQTPETEVSIPYMMHYMIVPSITDEPVDPDLPPDSKERYEFEEEEKGFGSYHW